MSSRFAALKQSDLTRYAKALRAAGFETFRVVMDPATGRHEIIAGPSSEPIENPCDRLLE
jgi:hypothetical protein